MTRSPAVAGRFYPADPKKLREMVAGYIENAEVTPPAPKAIIAPHAGYIYSGPVAGTAYAHLQQRGDEVKRVILLGPSHRMPSPQVFASPSKRWATPLGETPLDQDAHDLLEAIPEVVVHEAAHVQEHSLEVHLPFLQAIFADFTLVPLAIGPVASEVVAQILDLLWGGDETAIVVSSDLTHFYDYKTAVRLDRATADKIETFEPVEPGMACGRVAINGLLQIAKQKNLRVKTVDLRNSGDTAGSRREVVGYGAWVFWAGEA